MYLKVKNVPKRLTLKKAIYTSMYLGPGPGVEKGGWSPEGGSWAKRQHGYGKRLNPEARKHQQVLGGGMKREEKTSILVAPMWACQATSANSNTESRKDGRSTVHLFLDEGRNWRNVAW